MTDMKRVARVLDIVKDLIDRDPMVTFDDPLFNDDLTDFVRPHFVTTHLTNALKRDDDNAFDTFVKLLKANGVDNALDMAIAMRFTHITDDFDKGLDVTFHPADNKHLLRLAVDDVVNVSTVLTKRDNAARVFFHVRLDTL